MSPRFKNTSPGGFYGWYAMAGAMLVTIINAGIYLYAFGIFLPVISAEFGWSRGLLSTSVTLAVLFFGLPSPLWGVLINRFGTRKILFFGNLLAGLGLAGMSLIQELWHCHLFYSLAGLGAGMGGVVACSTVANSWFIRKRSLALGAITAAGGLGGFVFPPIMTLLIASIGWRMSWVALGGTLFVLASLLGGLLLVRNRPEDMGQMPDGMAATPLTEAEVAEPVPEKAANAAGNPVKLAMRQPTFWMIVGFTAAFSVSMGTISNHQVAYLTDAGFSPMTAAMTMSLFSVMHIVGSLGLGTLALRIHIRYLTMGCFAIQITALAILLTTTNTALIYIYSMLFGIAAGGIVTATSVFVGVYYHRALYSRIFGMILPFQTAAMAASASIAGGIYDATGGYMLAFAIITALGAIGLICAFSARKPKNIDAVTA
jgi:sugar phosphate permease